MKGGARDSCRNRDRNVVELCFGNLKQWSGITMRTDKLARNYHSDLCLAASISVCLSSSSRACAISRQTRCVESIIRRSCKQVVIQSNADPSEQHPRETDSHEKSSSSAEMLPYPSQSGHFPHSGGSCGS